ncbi:MAG TPA: hypothetical protein VFI92_04640 [Steroidobacteraceae bacterium]|nr:hypothetical protein [Steroidobacteraceae bacterium]
MRLGRSTVPALLAFLLATAGAPAQADDGPAALAPLPGRLSETGLFAPGSVTEITPRAVSFSPQYPLWSDGATKRRWISLPPGTFVDASNPDAWVFPLGTKLWKEFAVGRRVETRYIERAADGSWRFGTYVWNVGGTDATLAPAEGIAALPLERASRGGTYAIPGEFDCRACHEGAPVPVLGFSALQLSADRDPLAPHAEASPVDLDALVAQGLVRHLPRPLRATPPRIAARTPTERAALGYLHGNCGHCHSTPGDSGAAVPVPVVLAQSVAHAKASAESVRRSLVDAASRFRPHGGAEAPSRLVVPGRSAASVLPLRMRSRDPRVQMPPLGTALADRQAVELIERWIDQDLNDQRQQPVRIHTQEETSPWTVTRTQAGSR